VYITISPGKRISSAYEYSTSPISELNPIEAASKLFKPSENGAR
jgi:hypothetical protein